jgi:hypothetical protein
VGWLAIETVELIALKELTRADAEADGFASLASLRTLLRELYPSTARDGKRWFRVRFSLMKAVTVAVQ